MMQYFYDNFELLRCGMYFPYDKPEIMKVLPQFLQTSLLLPVDFDTPEDYKNYKLDIIEELFSTKLSNLDVRLLHLADELHKKMTSTKKISHLCVQC